MYSYHASGTNRIAPPYGEQYRSELSSPDDESSNIHDGKLLSNGDPSSSSMSGYDIK